MSSFDAFRKQYLQFIYSNYQYKIVDQKILIEFIFEIEDLATFRPKIEINFNENLHELNLEDLDDFIFQYGLVESISYWKATCSKRFTITCGFFEENMIPFWKKLFYKGLGEFRYLNKINCSLDDFISFDFNSSAPHHQKSNLQNLNLNGCLLPIGGGKDSLVSLDMLQKQTVEFDLFLLNPQKSALQLLKDEHIVAKNIISAKRTIDKNLLRLNKERFLNGHTPFSAMLAFLLNICAVVKKRKFLVLSNEASANEGNAKILNEEVNHQYSKSLEFELDFTNYNKNFLSKDIEYFSLLRTLSELEIAHKFSALTRFFTHFRSCNAGRANDCWCCKCPKCLFVWIMLSPFLSHEQLLNIFKVDLWQSEHLLSDFDALIGLTDVKPFECVGTVSEVTVALEKVVSQKSEDLPLLLKRYLEKRSQIKKVDNSENSKIHNIPQSFIGFVK